MEPKATEEFFDKLKAKEAKLVLQNYLEISSKGFSSLEEELNKANIIHDYSFASLPALFEWVSGKMVKIPDEPDYSLPQWITDTDNYKKGLYHFDEESGNYLLRVSYYWGECFVRNTKLKWVTGQFAEHKNQPVLRPFIRNLEMMPYKICESFFRTLAEGEPVDESIPLCIDTWLSFID